MRTVSRLYDNYTDAVAVVDELEATSLHPDREISLVAGENAHGRVATEPHEHEKRATGAGAGGGAAVGGIVGILAGLGVLAIPGIGPLVAAGWLATTLAGIGAGAVAGGLIGALTKTGVSREEAEVYEEGVRRGSTLVVVRADEADIPIVEGIMDRRSTLPWHSRREEYIASGWKPTS